MKIFLSNRLAGLYLFLLLVAALIPLGMGTTLNNNYVLQVRSDYLLHALFYIPLPGILLLSRWGRRGGWIPVILLSSVVVVLFESVQLLIPYRAFNINDLFANGVGVVIGFTLYLLFRKRLAGIMASAD